MNTPRQTRTRRRLRVLATAACWAYALCLGGVWALLRLGGDAWWFATCLLFAPRWAWGLPLAALLPLAWPARRQASAPLLIAIVILVIPIMGLRVSWRRAPATDAAKLRVLTCNVQGSHVDEVSLSALIRASAPDLVALQECRPNPGLNWPPDWDVRQAGQLVLASRYPILELRISQGRLAPGRPAYVNAMHGAILRDGVRLGFGNVHLQTAGAGLAIILDRHTGISRKRRGAVTGAIEFRDGESAAVAQWLTESGGPMVVAGDFNMPVDSAIYRRHWAIFENAFSRAGNGLGYTKNSTIAKLRYGLRIDHVLVSEGWEVRRCWVGPDVGSDHLPLLADLAAE